MIDINLNRVRKSFGFDLILDNINLTINKGEKVALIGANGSGKSTLLKIIAGIENVDSGDVAVRKYASVGYLGQIPIDSGGTVEEYIYDSFRELMSLKDKLTTLENNLSSDMSVIVRYTKLQEKFAKMGGYELETKVSKVLVPFNITTEMLKRPFNTLSGGEKTICSLIKLLLVEPDILLLDEPTNHLDIKRVEWLEKYLYGYKGSVIIVSHDRYFLDKITNKTILLTKRGVEVYFGNYSYFIKENENRVLLEFKNYKDQQKIINAMNKAIKRLQEYGRLCGDSGGEIFFRRANSIKKRLERMEKTDKPQVKRKININFNSKLKSGKQVLIIKDYCLNFKDKVLLDHADIEIFAHDKVCLIGNNGSGKSTLIKQIIKQDAQFKIGEGIVIGYIPQEVTFDNVNYSIIDEARRFFIGTDEQLRSALYKFLFVGENVYKKLKYLSGGEKIRLKLFCLVQKKYNFLILDEPTNHIDIDTREILENALIEFSGTILFVSHDRYFINKVANIIVELKEQKMQRYIGNYDDYKRYINQITK